MSEFFKNKYKLLAVVGVFMLLITSISVIYARSSLKGGEIVKGDSSLEASVTEIESSEATDPSEPESQEPKEPVVRIPSTMRGVFVTPGVEFLTSEEDSSKEIKKQIDESIATAKELDLNTILINTNYKDQVIYKTPDSDTYSTDFDVMEYIVETAKEEDFYVYGIFDVSKYKNGSSSKTLKMDSGSMNHLMTNAGEFAEKYELNGILLDGYQNETTEESYGMYAKLGGAIGFENFMRSMPESMLVSASKGIKEKSPATQVGLLADPVWANESDEKTGSKTNATYTSLKDGNADTKGYVESGKVDFVAIKAFTTTSDQAVPFTEVVEWWTGVTKKENIPLYVLQASSKVNSGEAGWGSADELVKQVAEIDEIRGVRGNAYDSLLPLANDSGGVTSTLKKHYKEEKTVEKELVLTKLEMTKPAQTTYNTTETQVVFTGAIDPKEPVLINDVTIVTDQSGYFTAMYDLKAGLNTFTIKHKEQTVTYDITRDVNILTDMSPTAPITTDGGMEIRISATAYEGSTVVASVGGGTVTLTVDEDVVDESNRDSSYKTYTGVYNAPAATGSVQNLGSITVTANWNGETKSLQGGSVTVNKKAKIEDGVPVVVVAGQAKTYPVSTLDNIPDASCYPLPKGAMDYAVGEEIKYKDVKYTTLASGLRVKSSDIAPSKDFPSENVISGISVESDGGFTYVTLKTAQKVSYDFSYSSSGITIKLNNTKSVPEDTMLSKNPLFSAAKWNGSSVTLPLIKENGFMGYRGYYDEQGNLVFRFNNTPSHIGAARIVIDPGHGGSDYGALGFLTDYPEKAINWAIASSLAEELEGRGATVLLLDTSSGMSLADRVAAAENFDADLFVSVHSNTSANAKAQGTEVYYFTPYSKLLATNTSANVSAELDTNNRGAKQSYYTVTLSSEFPSILVETGFMTNKDEYEKLIRPKYQDRIAGGIADGISSTINGTYTGVNNSGSEGAGGNVSAGNSELKPPLSQPELKPPASQGGLLDPQENKGNITLDRKTLTLKVGGSLELFATVIPDQKVRWTSSDTSVATVSNRGVVTAVKSGTCTITSTSAAGDKDTCVVTVTAKGGSEISVEELYLSESSVSVDAGKTHQLDAEVYPVKASDTSISWKSDNPSIVTVDGKGLITAHKSGDATITATSSNPKVKATCRVTVLYSGNGEGNSVSDLRNVKEIYLSGTQTTMFINTTQTLTVKSEKDKQLSNNSFIWNSSDKSIATVDSNGVVKAKRKDGTVKISVYDKSDRLYDSVTITVTKEKVAVTDITLDVSEIVLEKGEKQTVKATIKPSNATHADLQWRISNTNIATVDDNGVITARNTGKTTLIVRAKNNSVQAQCSVEVVGKGDIEILDVDLYDDKLEMRVGDDDILFVTTDPEYAKTKGLKWVSSQPNVVSVDGNGKIQALSAGRATITVSAENDPSIRDTCQIIVYGSQD